MSRGGGGGGGDSDTFFFDLKIFASILQAHSRGTLRTSQTSDKQQNKKKTFFFSFWPWDISISAWECGEMREIHAQCVRVGSSASYLEFYSPSIHCHENTADSDVFSHISIWSSTSRTKISPSNPRRRRSSKLHQQVTMVTINLRTGTNLLTSASINHSSEL